MNKDRFFFRIVFSLALLVLLGLITGGFAKILAYFNSGASLADLLNIPKELPDTYTPKVIWLDDDAETGRKMEDFSRSAIAKDYVRALYQRNLGLLTGQKEGIKEYYTLEARPKIFSAINEVKKNKLRIEHAELNHALKLHFYSADGQLISFTDKAVESRFRSRNKKGERLAFGSEVIDYKVIMQLDDGYWRIKHLEKQAVVEPIVEEKDTLRNDEKKLVFLEKIKTAKGINYYPQQSPWKDFWLNYDTTIIEKDLALMRNLGANSVRIFINYEQFGKGNVVPEMLLRLDHFLATAQKNNIYVLVTLFDFNSNYQLLNFPATDRQLETLLTRYRSNDAILGWDLKNEPDLDFHYQNPEDVKEWLELMIRQARKYDPIHPITIGWAFPENAELYAQKLDFISFHYYKKIDQLSKIIDNLRLKMPEKPLVLEEFGLSSYQSLVFPIGVSEAQQASYLAEIIGILSTKKAVSFYYWTLYDFDAVSGEIAGNRPWQRNAQKHFGLVSSNGNIKKVGLVFKDRKKRKESLQLFDRIQPFWISYLFFGVIFAVIFYYKKSFVRLFQFVRKV
jgi:aryl-phospho-beta-D-glucosidase BglC (GH1 family)